VRVLGHLDEELARIPLGSGLRPVARDRTLTMTRRLGENTWRGFLGKAGNKVWRTLGARRRSAVGTSHLATAVVAHWRENPSALEPVLATGLVNPAWTERLLWGSQQVDATAVDFLLNMHGITCRVAYSK